MAEHLSSCYAISVHERTKEREREREKELTELFEAVIVIVDSVVIF